MNNNERLVDDNSTVSIQDNEKEKIGRAHV